MISEIVENLYIGTIHDAIHDKTKWALIVCVAEWDTLTKEERDDLMVQCRPIVHIPFMVYSRTFADDPDQPWIRQSCWADKNKISLIADMIGIGLAWGKVLVHCAAGVERSPLAVICYLFWKSVVAAFSLEDTFAFVKARRPCIENRLEWLRHE